jgi:hypothetical protein
MTEESAREQRELLSDEEVFRRMRASPTVQARIEEAVAERRERARRPPHGFTKEELVEFLREHG